MTYDQALAYISTVSSRGGTPGLGRIRTLMEGLGNVQNSLKFVHLAGTNGKGSTSCMLSNILMQAGYKTGLFVSPFIIRFNERMQINGQHIPDEKLAEIVERVSKVADAMDERLTEFELITAIPITDAAETITKPLNRPVIPQKISTIIAMVDANETRIKVRRPAE